MKWQTITEHIDLETGEIITALQAKTAYVIVKTIKEANVKIYKEPTDKIPYKVQRKYTKLCRRKVKQASLWG